MSLCTLPLLIYNSVQPLYREREWFIWRKVSDLSSSQNFLSLTSTLFLKNTYYNKWVFLCFLYNAIQVIKNWTDNRYFIHKNTHLIISLLCETTTCLFRRYSSQAFDFTMYATSPIHFTFFNLLVPIMPCEEYTSLSFSLGNISCP